MTRLEQGMQDAVAPVVQNLTHSNLLTDLEGSLAGWGTVQLSDFSFPWDRAFEMDMEITLGALTQPHKDILGVYYQ